MEEKKDINECNLYLFKNGKGFVSNTIKIQKNSTSSIFNDVPKTTLGNNNFESFFYYLISIII